MLAIWVALAGALAVTTAPSAAAGPATVAAPPPGKGIASAASSPAPPVVRYETDYPLIAYSDPPSHNPIARLQDRLDRGELHLKFVPERGYLDSVLQALGIASSSQTLVYSKTSLQFDLISAATPRAIYFDDDTYVAWPPGTKILEIATMDSLLGPVFYTLPNTDPAATHFDRETLRCLNCHDTFSLTGGGVPRFSFLSSPVSVAGEPLATEVSIETTDTTPLEDRWGGWYVTGKPSGVVHLGNIQVNGPVKNTVDFASLKVSRPGTLEKLDSVFDTKPYITDHSDVVALLVFEHQVSVENLISRAIFKTRTLVARANDGAAPDSMSWDQLPPKARPMVKAMLEPVVKALLLVDAAPLPEKIEGNSGFDAWFQAQGPRDAQGRSLRELDLKTRLFRYPLSYMIYSAGFDGLPAYAREYIYQRLGDVLAGRDKSAPFARLSDADRAAMLEILTATKPAFAAAMKAAVPTYRPDNALSAGGAG